MKTILVPDSDTSNNKPIDRERIIAELPLILEDVLNTLILDFDYEANINSNVAIAARLLAVTIDRLGGSQV